MHNSSETYLHVYTAYGSLSGEIMRIFLESMNIPVILQQESAGVSYGLTVGSLGEVQVLVPQQYYDQALQAIKDMDEGRLENAEYRSKYESGSETSNHLTADEDPKKSI